MVSDPCGGARLIFYSAELCIHGSRDQKCSLDLAGLEVLLFIFQGFGSRDCFLSLPIWLEGLNFV